MANALAMRSKALAALVRPSSYALVNNCGRVGPLLRRLRGTGPITVEAATLVL